jgi:hypothetical protein
MEGVDENGNEEGVHDSGYGYGIEQGVSED